MCKTPARPSSRNYSGGEGRKVISTDWRTGLYRPHASHGSLWRDRGGIFDYETIANAEGVSLSGIPRNFEI